MKKLMAAFLIASITQAVGQLQPAVSKADVREAVLRYQISSWDLAADSYCVKIDGKDADKSFLSRFKSLPVKPASGCKMERPAKLPKIMYSIVDKTTKKRSVIFSIADVRFPQPATAEVDGGYECASECMAMGTYSLIWDGLHWDVSRFEIKIQS